MRRSQKIDGKPILTLPPRVTEVKHAVFEDHQRDYYKALETQSQLRFNTYLKAGTVNKNYTNALVLLLRLRQCCDHPHLIKDHAETIDPETKENQEALANDFSDAAIAMIKDSDGAFTCPICYDGTENPTIFFPCGHDVSLGCDPQPVVGWGERLLARLARKL